MNAAVRRTVQILSSQLTDGAIDVHLALKASRCRARGSIPRSSARCSLNLIKNAMQAMDGHGKISGVDLRAPLAPRPDALVRWRAAAVAALAGREDTASLSRSGCATPGRASSPKVLRNLFIRRSSRRSRKARAWGSRSGQSIVRNAGGVIEVHSQPGAGTTFTIVLPLGRRRPLHARPRTEPHLQPALGREKREGDEERSRSRETFTRETGRSGNSRGSRASTRAHNPKKTPRLPVKNLPPSPPSLSLSGSTALGGGARRGRGRQARRGGGRRGVLGVAVRVAVTDEEGRCPCRYAFGPQCTCGPREARRHGEEVGDLRGRA